MHILPGICLSHKTLDCVLFMLNKTMIFGDLETLVSVCTMTYPCFNKMLVSHYKLSKQATLVKFYLLWILKSTGNQMCQIHKFVSYIYTIFHLYSYTDVKATNMHFYKAIVCIMHFNF